MNLLDYWDLKKHPFEGTCDENFYYESEDHSEALHRLRFIIENRNMNMGLLTGEIGTGKTLLGNIIKNEIHNNTENYIIHFPSSSFDFINLMRGIVAKLQQISPMELPINKFELMYEFENFVEKNVLPNQNQIIIILDEAQGISKEDMDNIKNLTNTGNENQLAVTVILIGEPRLRQIISSMPQIDQRVSIRYHLNFMNKTDTYKYIRHRLLVANNNLTNYIFTNEAVDFIYQNSKGIPREINRACKLALEYGYGLQLNRITKNDMQLIFNDIKNDYRIAV